MTNRSAARACLALHALLTSAVALAATGDTNVQRSPQVSIAYPESSQPLAEVPLGAPPVQIEHPIRTNPFLRPRAYQPDPVMQTLLPAPNMPAPIVNFAGQGHTTSPSTVTGTPPDPVGAAGPNHYVQAVNGGIAIWNKSGAVVQASHSLVSLWAGYSGTNLGNGCATRNDGDPIVLYDRFADRWFISQFSLPNTSFVPSYQCVAVSKTGDPTGAYWLYDFRYNGLNDYAKFGVWPDGYYATFNLFANASTYAGALACVYDRQSMLAGQPAAQQCFQQSPTVYGLLPATVDGSVPPPRGEPGFFVELGEDASSNFDNTLHLYTLKPDWLTPANTTFTGPVVVPVSAFTWPCQATGSCIPALGGPALDALGDRLMFRLAYRNFGTHESVVVNHTVTSGSQTGIRWYELRSPTATPTVYQQGTYAPADANWRWMGSIAQDQAQNLALGFSISSSTTHPSIAWTGRVPTDTSGQMGQGESTIATGTQSETSTTRWGDYSAMTVDPVDDCTFWFTSEYYRTAGSATWDTDIAAMKFSNCAQNDFSLSVTPSPQTVPAGGQVTCTVSTAITKAAAETIALNIQDLPSGVTGAFNPASVTAGGTSTLTLTATAAAPVTATPVTFTVIGKATAAVHAATAALNVTTPPAPPAPTQVVATASSSSQVDVSWNAVASATGYEVFRRDSHGFASIGTPATNAFSDTTVAANTAYVYKVQAVNAGGHSGDSNSDLATTVIFTDDPLVSGTTFVKAQHMTELRTAIAAVATLAGTGPLTFTDPTLSSDIAIKSVHVTELRANLNTALGALTLPALTFANSAASGTAVGATDFQELRSGVK